MSWIDIYTLLNRVRLYERSEVLENLLKWKTWLVVWDNDDCIMHRFKIHHFRLFMYFDVLKFIFKHGLCETRMIKSFLDVDEIEVVSAKAFIPKDKSEFLEVHYIID